MNIFTLQAADTYMKAIGQKANSVLNDRDSLMSFSEQPFSLSFEETNRNLESLFEIERVYRLGGQQA